MCPGGRVHAYTREARGLMPGTIKKQDENQTKSSLGKNLGYPLQKATLFIFPPE